MNLRTRGRITEETGPEWIYSGGNLPWEMPKDFLLSEEENRDFVCSGVVDRTLLNRGYRETPTFDPSSLVPNQKIRMHVFRNTLVKMTRKFCKHTFHVLGRPKLSVMSCNQILKRVKDCKTFIFSW